MHGPDELDGFEAGAAFEVFLEEVLDEAEGVSDAAAAGDDEGAGEAGVERVARAACIMA